MFIENVDDRLIFNTDNFCVIRIEQEGKHFKVVGVSNNSNFSLFTFAIYTDEMEAVMTLERIFTAKKQHLSVVQIKNKVEE